MVVPMPAFACLPAFFPMPTLPMPEENETGHMPMPQFPCLACPWARGWRTAFNWTAFTNAVHFFMNDTRTAFMYIERNENANGNVEIWWTWTRTGRKKYEREKERAALFCHTEMNNIASKWDNNIVVVSVWVKQWSLYLFCRLRVFKNHFNFN